MFIALAGSLEISYVVLTTGVLSNFVLHTRVLPHVLKLSLGVAW